MRFYHCRQCLRTHWEDQPIFPLHVHFMDDRGVLIATLAERERMREEGTA